MRYEDNKAIWVLFTIIVTLQLLVAIYFKSNIQDLFVDEYYTFNFSCANYFPLLWDCSSYSNMWLTQDFWHKLLTVQQDEIFNFASVYYNTAQDVHPPVYYFFEHFFFSFFPDQYNIWIALLPNFIAFILAQIILFLICLHIWETPKFPLLICGVYGFSVGAMNTIVLIRMYMLLTLWCLLYFYISLLYFEKKDKKCLTFLFIINILGFLTHYYFALFSAMIYFAMCHYFYRNKQYIDILLYSFVCIAALFLAFWLFPEAYVHIFGSSSNSIRGEETISNFFSPIKFNIRTVMLILDMPLLVLVGLFLFNFALKCLFDMDSVKFSLDDECWKYHVLGIVFVLLLVLIVAKICPFFESRYFYFLYPFIVLASVDCIYIICKLCQYKQYAFIYFLISIFSLTPYFFVKDSVIRYEGFNNLNIIKSGLQEKQVNKCVMITEKYDPVCIVYNMGIILNTKYTYITSVENFKESNMELEDKVLIFLEDTLSEQEENKILQYMFEKYGMVKTKVYEQSKFIIGKNILLEKL